MRKKLVDCSQETRGLSREQYRLEKQREYNAAYRAKNKEKISERAKIWAQQNPESIRRSKEKWKKSNPEKHRLSAKESYLRNYPAHRENYIKNAKRRSALLKQATPKWANKRKMYLMGLLAKSLELSLDHIVPINSPIVCGLHCEANLQIITLRENIQKYNTTWPDMP